MQHSWRQMSMFVTKRDGACVRCGSTFRLSAHHVIAREDGGADHHPENLEALCASCHGRATAAEHRR
jgi:5-methylcytosine-specific restriction endonuclease McrA